jgi:hypothetical protein
VYIVSRGIIPVKQGPLGNVFYGLVQGGGLLTLFIAVREGSTVFNQKEYTYKYKKD